MNKRTQNMVNKMKKLHKPSTILALVIYIFSDHLLLHNFVNGQISRSDYRSGFLVTNPCVSKQTCSECLQTPTCAWCMKEVRYALGMVNHTLNINIFFFMISHNNLSFSFLELYINRWSTPPTV